jgi:hypothetical protein
MKSGNIPWSAAIHRLPDGTVLIAGGIVQNSNPQTPKNTVEAYDPTNNTWTLLDAMEDARIAHTLTALPDGRAIAVGGWTGSSSMASAEILGAHRIVVVVKNVAPEITSLSVSPNLVNENGTATVTGSFTDPGTLDTHTVVIDWNAGGTSAAPARARRRSPRPAPIRRAHRSPSAAACGPSLPCTNTSMTTPRA